MKHFASFLLAVVITLPAYTRSNSFGRFEEHLGLVERDAKGILEPAVELSQGKVGDDRDSQAEEAKGNAENARRIRNALRNRVQRNMDFLRGSHIRCVLQPDTCGEYRPDLQNGSKA